MAQVLMLIIVLCELTGYWRLSFMMGGGVQRKFENAKFHLAPVVQWVRDSTAVRKVPGSSPAWVGLNSWCFDAFWLIWAWKTLWWHRNVWEILGNSVHIDFCARRISAQKGLEMRPMACTQKVSFPMLKTEIWHDEGVCRPQFSQVEHLHSK